MINNSMKIKAPTPKRVISNGLKIGGGPDTSLTGAALSVSGRVVTDGVPENDIIKFSLTMKNNENRSSQSVVDSRGAANSGKKLID